MNNWSDLRDAKEQAWSDYENERPYKVPSWFTDSQANTYYREFIKAREFYTDTHAK